MLTGVNKIKHRDANTKCYMCSYKGELYRLAIADVEAESAFFLPLCKECAKDLADEIISTIEG